MKRILLFAFFGTLFQFATAQPVLNYADIPFMAQTAIAVDSVDHIDLSGQVGADLTWDLSDLSGVGAAFNYTVVETESTLYAPAFPNSNYAYEVMDIFFYWNGSSDAIEDHGFAMMIEGYSMTQIYADPKTQIEFPLTYQSTGSDDFESTTDMAGFFTIEEAGTRNWSVDGYGTLILPSGTFTDVLLIHVEESSMSEQDVFGTVINIETTVDEYIFYAAGYQFPLGIFSSVTTDDGFQEETTYSGAVLNSQGVSVAESAVTALTISPNPANDQINVQLPRTLDHASIKLTALSGQLVREIPLNGLEGTFVQLEAADLPRGIYLVELQAGGKLFRSKVVLD